MVAPFSQELEPPQTPGRFTVITDVIIGRVMRLQSISSVPRVERAQNSRLSRARLSDIQLFLLVLFWIRRSTVNLNFTFGPAISVDRTGLGSDS